MKIAIETWLLFVVHLGVGLASLIGGLAYSGWSLRGVFVDNDAAGMVTAWALVIAEILGFIFLWRTRPRRNR